MALTEKDVLDFVKEQGVKFVRLAFCDIFGVQKNISIMPHQLEKAFSHGISFDASAVKGFLGVDKSDLFLKPMPETMCILPWRSQNGLVIRLICNIVNPDGSPFEGSCRHLLANAKQRAATMGYTCNIGAECEFYLFPLDDSGRPMPQPLDEGGYFDVFPLDKGENLRREICLTLEQMGINPERSHHEQGPGQNEIDFKYDDVLTTADNLITFRWAVATIAQSNGLYASFEPKPIEGCSGNGLHVNISMVKGGVNIFDDTATGGELCDEAKYFIAGILNRIKQICAFTNPKEQSYERLGVCEAPRYITWSRGNRSQLIRIPYASKESKRIELRNPDCTCNPYLAFALILSAGLEGIENKEELTEESCENAYEIAQGKYDALPATLEEAKQLAAGSKFAARVLGEKAIADYLGI
ncbi:MAG: glutamine synthetase family protein [Clostridia bacterium]|nr:glutamine synthetase family protein [Clostridia bacterium]